MSFEKVKIAIADDHSLVRKGLIHILHHRGFEVIAEASNGSELLKLIKNRLPDVILLDVNMPILDGVSTMQQIHNLGLNVKVLALSMMDNDSSVIRMIKAGAKGYLLKDCEPDELVKGIQAVLEDEFYYSENIAGRAASLQFNTEVVEKSTKLSKRELDFLVLAASELSYKEIADKMIVSIRTIDGYRDSIFTKLKIQSRIGLVFYALKNKIIRLND